MLVASILLGIMSTARADGFMSGNDIFQNCGSSDPLRHQYCGWYVLGAVDGFQTDQDNLKKTLGSCLPRVTQGQIIDIVVKFHRQSKYQALLRSKRGITRHAIGFSLRLMIINASQHRRSNDD
jgi:hypothetical protein